MVTEKEPCYQNTAYSVDKRKKLENSIVEMKRMREEKERVP